MYPCPHCLPACLSRISPDQFVSETYNYFITLLWSINGLPFHMMPKHFYIFVNSHEGAKRKNIKILYIPFDIQRIAPMPFEHFCQLSVDIFFFNCHIIWVKSRYIKKNPGHIWRCFPHDLQFISANMFAAANSNHVHNTLIKKFLVTSDSLWQSFSLPQKNIKRD